MTPTDLSIDDDSGLAATGHATPRLSWRLTGDGVRQEAYEIEVAADAAFATIVGRSGEVADRRPYLRPWQGPALTSRDVRWWRVRARIDGAWTGWSAAARVEASLLAASDWTARPVSPRSNVSRTAAGPVPLLRRAFALDAAPVSARLYVTALGVLDVQINGAPVSADVLEPGWTVYPKRLLFSAYDVTALLRAGGNVISAAVGDGWYRGDLTWNLKRNIYGDTTALLAQLEVTFADGRTLTVGTDSDWRGGYGSLRLAELYHGAETDLAAEPTGWREPGFDDSGWEPVDTLTLPAGLAPRAMPAVRVVERRPLSLPAATGTIDLDVGQNITGWLRLTASGPAGARIVVRHAEVLGEDRTLFTASLRNARATDSYVLDGKAHELAPAFTFHGFRYAEIACDPGVTITSAVAEVASTDLRQTGRFACSEPDLNRLFDNAVWSQRGNFLAVPTDCPQRDERLGWTGDLQVFAPTACLNADARGFLRSWLVDLALEQKDGSVPFVVPNVLAGQPRDSGAAAWGDAATVTPWVLLATYGDEDALAAQFASMRGWVDWIASRTEADGSWTQDFQFGDWLDPDAPPERPSRAKVPREFVATSYLAMSAGKVAAAARRMGDADLAAHYDALRARSAAAAWTGWGEAAMKTPTGCALAICFEICPAEQRTAIGAQLADIVERNGHRIGTGFVGTPLMLPALAATGHLDVAYRLLLNRDCPGWLYQVRAGATTIWERWDALRPDGLVTMGEGVAGNSMVSFNHYAYGAVAAWLYNAVAGLNVDFADIETPFTLAPKPGGGLAWAEASLDTAYGRLAIRWDRQGENLQVTAVVPPGAVARFEPPEGYAAPANPVLVAGSHAFTLTPA